MQEFCYDFLFPVLYPFVQIHQEKISIGNHMLLSAIIPKLHEKACNCLLII